MSMFTDLTDRMAPVLDSTEYPSRWSDYVGQDRAKKALQIAARSARARKQPLDHTLIAHSTPGVGKTALAVLLAKEMRTGVRVVTGALTRDKARMIFSAMNDGDILFWDEIHQMMDSGRKNAEWTLTFLQDGYIQGPLGPEMQPRITIVGATTDATKIPQSILSRFPNTPLMDDYTTDQAAKIAQKLSVRVLGAEGLPTVTAKDATALATAANNNPRAMRQLLVNLRDMTVVGELAQTGKSYDIAGLLDFLGITADGLDYTMQRYLSILAEVGGQAGARALEDRLQLPGGGLAFAERALMDKGYIAKTRTGRQLTQAGIKRFRFLQLEVAA